MAVNQTAVFGALALNAVGIVFGGGMLYQRVSNIEAQHVELRERQEKYEAILSDIRVVLGRIDERLKTITEKSAVYHGEVDGGR